MNVTEPASTARPADGSRRAPMALRMRSDEELVRRFRAGDEDAFRVIHDRYRARLFAFTRQMLRGSGHDAEDALQDVFVRAHAALRADARDVSLRAWLYRIAHNRCIDELRRPQPPSPESLALLQPPPDDPIVVTDRRESLRRLVVDIGRLPEQQRAALLMRELGGMSYDDIAAALTITLPSVKSTLTRARMSLTTAEQARGAACHEIRERLAATRERGIRFDGVVRRHLHDCDACRAYRRELQATTRRIAALAPAFGPGALLAKLLGGATLLGGGAGTAASLGGGAGAGGATVGGGLLGLGGSQLAALAAVGAIGIGGGIAALDVGAGSSSQRQPAHRVLTVSTATGTALAADPLPAQKPSRRRRRPGALAPARARAAWATPRARQDRERLAEIGGFHLVWRDGAIEPVGQASAPRDPRARARWVDTAAMSWLLLSVEGRQLVERMVELPSTVNVGVKPDGQLIVRADLAGRTTASRHATQMVAWVWLSGTPQGKRVARQLRALARRDQQPAPPSPTVTPPQPAPVATSPDPAPPAPVTTPAEPAPAVTTPPPPAPAPTPAPAPVLP